VATPPPTVFRAKALERLSSPDRLDETIRIVSPKDWLPLVVLAALVILTLVWGFTGRIPTIVSGRGVLLKPRGVLDVQTLGAGRVEQLQVRAGDRVKQGDVLGQIDQFELRRRLDEDRAQLAELESQDRAQSRVQSDQTVRQQAQTGLTGAYVRSQSDNLRKTLADAQALAPLLEQRLASFRALRDKGLIASLAPELLDAERETLENASRITDAAARLKELDIQVAQAEASEMSLSRDNLQAGAARRGEIHRLRSTIAINEVQIEKNSQIVAAHSGRIIELLADTGQIVSAGARVARLEVDDASTALVNVAYLAVGDGKKVTPGMRVLITPDTVERQRYGGITGVVLAVSDLAVTTEGARAVLGNADLAQALVGGTTRIEVTASLDADSTTASGYKWSSSAGPGSPVTAGLTGEMRVIVEQRAPITFVLPFLRELSGVR